MINESLIKQLKEHEGLKLKPYKCTEGYVTIGYGRNLETNGISELEAELMLVRDIQESIKFLDQLFPWWKRLSEQRKNVIVDMHFNMGSTKLIEFHKMIDAIVNEDFWAASSEMLNSKWAKQVGARALKLSAMMRQG